MRKKLPAFDCPRCRADAAVSEVKAAVNDVLSRYDIDEDWVRATWATPEGERVVEMWEDDVYLAATDGGGRLCFGCVELAIEAAREDGRG